VEYSGKGLGATAASTSGQTPATPAAPEVVQRSGAGQASGAVRSHEPRWSSATEWLPDGQRTTQSPAPVVR